jgi:capsular exopolysaccharide synthesis family protein
VNSRSLVPLGSAGTELDTNVRYAPEPQWEEPHEVRNGFWATLRHHRLKILIALILGGLAGFLLATITPPTYRAQAQVELRQTKPPAGASPEAGADEAASQQFLETQLGIIRSRSLAQQVADSLTSARRARLAAALPRALPGSEGAAPVPNAELIDRLRGRVAVDVSGNSRLATISVETRDPTVSAEVANRYVEHFIQTNLQRQYDTTVKSRRFLESRLAEAKSRLEASERALNNYTRAAGLIDASSGTSSISGASSPQTLAGTDLITLNQASLQARSERITAQQRWQEATRTPLMSLPEVLSNPAIQQLTQKAAEAQAAYEQQRSSRLDTHPTVLAAAAHLKEINRQIDSLAGSIRNSIRDRYEVSRRQEADFARNVQRLKSQTLADQGKGVRYNVLKRDADSNRQLFTGLTERFNELSTSAGLVANDVAVVDLANPPRHATSPQPILWSGIGAAVALLLALAFTLIAALRDQHVRSPESIGANLQLRVLGVLPRVKNPSEALADPSSQLSEAHYSLRGSLEGLTPRPSSILFTSSMMGEGKSTAAFGVARDFALSGKRTLLIDGDMRKPTVHNYVGMDSPLGLSTVLADLCTDEAATLQTDTPGLSVILAGPMPPSPAALLSNGAFNALIKRLSRRYKIIVIDAPPIMGLADTPRMASAARQTVLVVESDRASLPNVRGALQRMIDARANVVGAVLTKFSMSSATSQSQMYVYHYPSEPGRPQLDIA